MIHILHFVSAAISIVNFELTFVQWVVFFWHKLNDIFTSFLEREKYLYFSICKFCFVNLSLVQINIGYMTFFSPQFWTSELYLPFCLHKDNVNVSKLYFVIFVFGNFLGQFFVSSRCAK